MLIFNERNKYEATEQTNFIREETVLSETSKSFKKKSKEKKLTKANIQFLKSLGFKLKQTQ